MTGASTYLSSPIVNFERDKNFPKNWRTKKTMPQPRTKRGSVKEVKNFESALDDLKGERRTVSSGRPQRRRARSSLRKEEGTRIRVKTACTNCKLAKARCDNGRPCSRCVKRGCERTCVDAVPKRRGRKRNQEGVKATLTKEANSAKPVEENDVFGKELEKESTMETIKPDSTIVKANMVPSPMKDKRRKIIFSEKRLDFLSEKDTFEENSVISEISSEAETEDHIKSPTTEYSKKEKCFSICSAPIPVDEPTTFFVRSPNNTMSDKEFDALFMKHENEHSTPEFSGTNPHKMSMELNSNQLPRFHLEEPVTSASLPLPSVSPSAFALNLVWNEPPASPTFSRIFT